jgi:hypothetical protein
MYFLGYVELFHPKLHGFDDLSYNAIDGFYITIFTIKTPGRYLSLLTKTSKMDFVAYYSYIHQNNSKELNYHKNILFYIKNRDKEMKNICEHPSVRNFAKIQEDLYTPYSLQIVEKIEMDTGESICILKTFWLRCIQRKWKKICNYNKKVLNEIKEIKFLKKRELETISSKFFGIKGLWFSRV